MRTDRNYRRGSGSPSVDHTLARAPGSLARYQALSRGAIAGSVGLVVPAGHHTPHALAAHLLRQGTRPASCTRRAICTRLFSSSLVRMRDTCVFTVGTLR